MGMSSGYIISYGNEREAADFAVSDGLGFGGADRLWVDGLRGAGAGRFAGR